MIKVIAVPVRKVTYTIAISKIVRRHTNRQMPAIAIGFRNPIHFNMALKSVRNKIQTASR